MNRTATKPRTRLMVHAAVSVFALGIVVWLTHVAAHQLVNTRLQGANVASLQSVFFLVQALLIGVFTLIIGSFVHRYPEPFFIFWYFGWIAWLFLYSARFLHHPHLDVPFDVLNTCFFLAAGLDLLLPKSLNRFFRRYPNPPGKTFGSPVLWLAKYYRNNPYSLLVLLTPIVVLGLIRHYFHPLFGYAEGLFAILSVGTLGYGLYRRLFVISPRTAFGTLLVYAIYLEPQIAKVVWPAVIGHEFDYLLTVSAPSLVLKPALALFVTLVALRETTERRDEAQNTLKAMVQNLPAACLFVKGKNIALSNDVAQELLGLRPDSEVELHTVFESQQEHDQFLAQLQKDGRTIGCYTKICTNGSTGGPKTTKWVRIDAFEARAAGQNSAREIVLLILDKHEVELAHVVFSLVHDYLSSRARHLSGGITQLDDTVQSKKYLEQLCNELLDGVGLVREEYREYWRVHTRAAEGAAVATCLDLAWAQALRACSADIKCDPQMKQVLGSLPPETRCITIGEGQLTIAIQNLFINAIQHTYKRENREDLSPIEVALSYESGYVSIMIRDHGYGFSNAVRRFLNNPTGVSADSIGLGLFRVKFAVAIAGGRVNAGNESENGGGWVEIRFPAFVPQIVCSLN